MKKMTTYSGLLLGALVFAQSASAIAPSVVYNNLTTSSGSFYNSQGLEFGDEIILGGNNRVLTEFRFDYYGSGFSGNETLAFRLYRNDGAFASDGITRGPGTLIYDNAVHGVWGTGVNGAGISYDFSGETVILPTRFTWTVQFGGIEEGETAGLMMYGPPSVGNNLTDFWQKNAFGVWEQLAEPGTDYSFGASIQAVPEPSTIALGVLGAGALLMAVRRRK